MRLAGFSMSIERPSELSTGLPSITIRWRVVVFGRSWPSVDVMFGEVYCNACDALLTCRACKMPATP